MDLKKVTPIKLSLSGQSYCPKCGTELNLIRGENTPEAAQAEDFCQGQMTVDLIAICPHCGAWDYYGYD